MTVRKFPDQEPRVESGPIRFGDDYTGIFLRGDYAVMHGMHLKTYLERYGENRDNLFFHMLMDFAETLLRADERTHDQSHME